MSQQFLYNMVIYVQILGTCFKVADAEVDPKWADNPKLIPNEEWAKRLTPESYFCTREGGTEPVHTIHICTHQIHIAYLL